MPPRKINITAINSHLVVVRLRMAPVTKEKEIRPKHKKIGLEDLKKKIIMFKKRKERSLIINLITISIIITLLRLISKESDGQYVFFLGLFYKIWYYF